jgi:hypothetical protein
MGLMPSQFVMINAVLLTTMQVDQVQHTTTALG